MEIWKDIPNYDGLYQASNLGRIKSLKFRKEKILKLGGGYKEYLTVELYINGVGKTRNVHQLIAETFLEHTPCGHSLVINHKDFNRLNNNLNNLEIITQRENTNLKHKKSSSQYTGVHWCKPRNKWRATIVIDKKQVSLGSFRTEYEAHLAYKNKLATLF